MNKGGKREGAGRPKLYRIRKTWYIEKQYIGEINKYIEGKTESERVNQIFKEYFAC
jgi:hypothetical protein